VIPVQPSSHPYTIIVQFYSVSVSESVTLRLDPGLSNSVYKEQVYLRDRHPGFDSRQGKIVLVSTSFTPVLGRPVLISSGYHGLFPRDKAAGP
jgi:hypothetical protein